jgi:hypothetical protein
MGLEGTEIGSEGRRGEKDEGLFAGGQPPPSLQSGMGAPRITYSTEAQTNIP